MRVFFDTNPPVSGGFNALDFNILEVSSCFSLLGGCPNLFDKELNCLSRKIVGRWDFTSLNLLSLLVRIRADNRGRDGLGFLKLGLETWININEMKGVTYDDKIILNNFDVGDIVFYDGEFYAFDLSTWKIGVFDPSDFDFDDVPCVDFFDGPNMAHFVINGVRFGTVDGVVYAIKGIYFVPSRDGLYLIFEMSGYVSEVGVRLKLIVFELDEDEWEWNRVWSIGENVFFIGVDVAFSINAEKLPLWKPGSICLFTGQGLIGDGPVEVGRAEMPSGLDELRYPKYWKKFRVYNMEEEEKGILGFDELSTDDYTRLFFPPPKWVKWTCPGSGDVEVDLTNLKLCDGDDRGDGGGNDAKFGAMVLEEVE